MKNLLFLLLLSVLLFSCKKSDSSNSNSSYWDVKYEITSNTAVSNLLVDYRDETGAVQSAISVNSLPWTYEAHWSKSASPQTKALSLAAFYDYGYQVTEAIYVNGVIVPQTSNPYSPILTYELQ